MQLTKTLGVTPEELFDALAGSIMQDIENATGKRSSRNFRLRVSSERPDKIS